jgi:site-specific recombinase XerD
MATTGFSPLKIAEVPRINPGLEILSAKALFLPTMDSPHTRRACKDGRGDPTHLQALKAVRAFLAWAATLDGITLRSEQIRGLLKLPKVTVMNPYLTLTKAEIFRLLDAAAQSGLRDYAMMLVFLGAGLRVSEVVNLSCRDVRQDGDSGSYIHVRRGKGKNQRASVPCGGLSRRQAGRCADDHAKL